MDIINPIIKNIDDPHELERMFRRDPEAFKESFLSAWKQRSDSPVLAAWNERLNFKENSCTERGTLFKKDFVKMGILAILAGISTRAIFYFVEQEALATINLLFGIFPFMAAYFISKNPPKKSIIYILGSIFLFSAVLINLLPSGQKDSTFLAYLHLPIFLWLLSGLAYAGNEYDKGSARLAYIKFNGEFCVLYASLAISGMLLTALTMQLFGFAGIDISEFYFKNIGLVGAASLAIVAAYLVSERELNLAKNVAAYIAKIFSPLALATLCIYLITIVLTGQNPFMDRDFLISFNGVLLGVWAVTIFSISGSKKDEVKSVSDYINFALLVLAIIIDSVAFSAIAFRLSSYGITPNRIVMLGINVLIWGNLFWTMLSYRSFLQGRSRITTVQDTVTRYLPVYGLWAALVAFVFPFLF